MFCCPACRFLNGRPRPTGPAHSANQSPAHGPRLCPSVLAPRVPARPTARSIVHDKYFSMPLSGASLLPSFPLLPPPPRLSPRSFHFLWLRPPVSQPKAKIPHSSSDTQRNATRSPRRRHLKKSQVCLASISDDHIRSISGDASPLCDSKNLRFAQFSPRRSRKKKRRIAITSGGVRYTFD